jgi:hypothetical protein
MRLETKRSTPAPVTREPALMKARTRWRCMASVVASEAYRHDGAISSWLHDHAHRNGRGVKGSDQLVRLLDEMTAAGMPPDQQDALLLDYVSGVRRDLTRPDRPAA